MAAHENIATDRFGRAQGARNAKPEPCAMAKRATELRKEPTAKRAIGAIDSRSDVAEAPVALRGIPLDLAPLLAPYKGKGKLTLRIERMAGAARLSAGRNNGDKSWSLSLDELEDLEYLLPENSAKAHTLALRVIVHDGVGASTLGVLDLPISPDAAGAAPAADPSGACEAAVSAGDSMQVRRLRDELAGMAAALAARESELAEAQRRSERAEAEARIAAAQVARDLERGRDACQAEQNARIAEREARAQTRMEEARESWRREMQDALSKAESSWKAGEADRLAAAEKKWRAQANKTLVEAQAETNALRGETEAELRRLSDDLARTRALIAERDAELTRMQSAIEAAHKREREQVKAALSKAEASWKAEAEARLAEAKTRWNERSAGAAAELTARCERAEAALSDARAQTKAAARSDTRDAELSRVRNALSATQATLAAREQDLAKARAAIEAAHKREREQVEAALSKAEASWKTEAEARLAEAETRWNEQSAGAAAELTARCERAETALADARDQIKAAARSDTRDAELGRVRNALSATQATLAAREQDFFKARAAIEAAHQREREQVEEALSKAEAIWRSDEADRLAAAEKHWQSEHGARLAEARARYEAAEWALAEMRTKEREQGGPSADRLRDELTILQTILDGREAELARLRAVFDHEDTSDPLTARRRPTAGSDEGREAARSGRRLIRDIVVVMGAVMALGLIYPGIEALLPEDWRADMPAIGTKDSRSAAPEKPALPSASPAAHDTAIVVRSVNLRAGPSTATSVLATLPRGADVEKIEQRGSWTLVQTRDKDDPSKRRQGWIFNSYIKLTGIKLIGARPEKSAVGRSISTEHGIDPG